MDTTIAANRPATVTADNAEQVLAAVADATEGNLYRFAFNGAEQDGLYSVTAGIADHEADNSEPDRIARIVISTPTSSPAIGKGISLVRTKSFTVRLPVASLDGSRPGHGRIALEVELREGAIALRATEPQGDQLVDYTYDLSFAENAPATTSVATVTFGASSEDVASLSDWLTSTPGLKVQPPTQA